MKGKRFIPALLWALLIFVLCSIPGKDLPTAGWMELVSFDKWAHLGIFAVQMILVLNALRIQYASRVWRFDQRWYWFAVVVAYGALTEAYQHLMLEDRVADLYDFLANTAGALAGWWVYERFLSARMRQYQ